MLSHPAWGEWIEMGLSLNGAKGSWVSPRMG